MADRTLQYNTGQSVQHQEREKKKFIRTMNQWQNESSCVPPSSSSLYRDEKNNNSACLRNGKDEVIDVLTGGGCSSGNDLSGNASARWTNPNGILNGTNTCAISCNTSSPTNITAMNGIRNRAGISGNSSSNIANATTLSSSGGCSNTRNINRFSPVVDAAGVRSANEKSPVQLGDGGVCRGERNPFVFQTCVGETSNNTLATSSQPGATCSNDGPFQSNWNPHLQSSFQSSSSAQRTSHQGSNPSNGLVQTTSSAEVSRSKVSLASESSIGEGNRTGNCFGGGSGPNSGVDSDTNRFRLKMEETNRYNMRENNNIPQSLNRNLRNAGLMMNNNLTRGPVSVNAPVGHRHQHQHRSHSNGTPMYRRNDENTSSNQYFSHPSPQEENLNSYHQNQHGSEENGVKGATSEEPLTHSHYHQYDRHHQELQHKHYFNCDQQQHITQRKRSFIPHPVIPNNLVYKN